MNLTQEQIDQIAKEARESVNKMWEDLCNVQPMPSDTISNLLKVAKSEEELRKERYKPVSGLGLMWIKNEDHS